MHCTHVLRTSSHVLEYWSAFRFPRGPPEWPAPRGGDAGVALRLLPRRGAQAGGGLQGQLPKGAQRGGHTKKRRLRATYACLEIMLLMRNLFSSLDTDRTAHGGDKKKCSPSAPWTLRPPRDFEQNCICPPYSAAKPQPPSGRPPFQSSKPNGQFGSVSGHIMTWTVSSRPHT